MNDSETTIMSLLVNLTKDVGDIKASIAVNTKETSLIQEHLKTLNGKVVTQEKKQQDTDMVVAALATSKRRWDDGLTGLLKQAGLFGLGILAAWITGKF